MERLNEIEGMADGVSPSPDFEDGLRNPRVLDSMERSAAERTWVAASNPVAGPPAYAW